MQTVWPPHIVSYNIACLTHLTCLLRSADDEDNSFTSGNYALNPYCISVMFVLGICRSAAEFEIRVIGIQRIES